MATFSEETKQRLNQKFFTDPDWQIVQEMWREALSKITDYTSIDKTQPAEHVKAELIARDLAAAAITEILQDNEMVSNPLRGPMDAR
jgi:hypothetical protein